MKRSGSLLVYYFLSIIIGCLGTGCSSTKYSMIGYCDTRPQAGNRILLNQIETLSLYDGQMLSYRIKELLLEEGLIMEYAPEQEYYLLQNGITKIDTANYPALIRLDELPILIVSTPDNSS